MKGQGALGGGTPPAPAAPPRCPAPPGGGTARRSARGPPRRTAGPTSPRRMPTWSQRFGGPLRDDQVDALVAFVMNWEDRALAEAQVTPALPPGEEIGRAS